MYFGYFEIEFLNVDLFFHFRSLTATAYNSHARFRVYSFASVSFVKNVIPIGTIHLPLWPIAVKFSAVSFIHSFLFAQKFQYNNKKQKKTAGRKGRSTISPEKLDPMQQKCNIQYVECLANVAVA